MELEKSTPLHTTLGLAPDSPTGGRDREIFIMEARHTTANTMMGKKPLKSLTMISGSEARLLLFSLKVKENSSLPFRFQIQRMFLTSFRKIQHGWKQEGRALLIA